MAQSHMRAPRLLLNQGSNFERATARVGTTSFPDKSISVRRSLLFLIALQRFNCNAVTCDAFTRAARLSTAAAILSKVHDDHGANTAGFMIKVKVICVVSREFRVRRS